MEFTTPRPSRIRRGIDYLREYTSDDLKKDICFVGGLIKGGIYVASPLAGTVIYNSLRTDFSSKWKKAKVTVGKGILTGLVSLLSSTLISGGIIGSRESELTPQVEHIQWDTGKAVLSYRDSIDVKQENYIWRRSFFPIIESCRPSNYVKIEGNTEFNGEVEKDNKKYQFQGTIPGKISVDSIKPSELKPHIKKIEVVISEEDKRRSIDSLFE